MCEVKRDGGIRKVCVCVCVFVWFINSFARDTCVPELPADIKGQEKMLRRRGTDRQEEGDSGWREIRHPMWFICGYEICSIYQHFPSVCPCWVRGLEWLLAAAEWCQQGSHSSDSPSVCVCVCVCVRYSACMWPVPVTVDFNGRWVKISGGFFQQPTSWFVYVLSWTVQWTKSIYTGCEIKVITVPKLLTEKDPRALSTC